MGKTTWSPKVSWYTLCPVLSWWPVTSLFSWTPRVLVSQIPWFFHGWNPIFVDLIPVWLLKFPLFARWIKMQQCCSYLQPRLVCCWKIPWSASEIVYLHLFTLDDIDLSQHCTSSTLFSDKPAPFGNMARKSPENFQLVNDYQRAAPKSHDSPFFSALSHY